jgi:hypothetical protein
MLQFAKAIVFKLTVKDLIVDVPGLPSRKLFANCIFQIKPN